MISVRLSLYFCLILIFSFVGSLFVRAQQGSGIVTVVIDPGHGGADPGCLTSRFKEKNIALAVSLKLGALINENHPDVKVFYTRSTDKTVPLYDRPVFANDHNADLFISVHVNAAKGASSASGTETWIMGVAKAGANMELVQSENSVILLEDDYSTRYQGFDPKSPASYIMFSMMQNTFQNQSLEFGSMVQQSFKTLGRVDRGVKQGGLLVLWRTTMPGVLVELGFISNSSEERFLASELGQNQLARSVYDAFKRYKTQVDSRSLFKASSGSSSSVVETTAAHQPDVMIPEATEPSFDRNISKTSSEIEFFVQIMASPKPVRMIPANFKNVRDVEQIQISPSLYKYIVLRTKDYAEAIQGRKKVLSKFPDAFVFAMKDGRIIPVNDALNELKK